MQIVSTQSEKIKLKNGKKEIPKLLTFGRGGFTVHYATVKLSESSSSKSCLEGYDSPDTFDCSKIENIPTDGIPVIDMRTAVKTAAGYKWVFHSPMVDVDLDDGAVDTFDLSTVSPLIATGLCNAWSGHAVLMADHAVTQKTQKRGSLDSVSVAEYVDGWREHNARIGRAYTTGIVFETPKDGGE